MPVLTIELIMNFHLRYQIYHCVVIKVSNFDLTVENWPLLWIRNKMKHLWSNIKEITCLFQFMCSIQYYLYVHCDISWIITELQLFTWISRMVIKFCLAYGIISVWNGECCHGFRKKIKHLFSDINKWNIYYNSCALRHLANFVWT